MKPAPFKLPLFALLLAASLSLGSLPSAFAQNEGAAIQEQMTPEQFKAAGLEKLSPAELAKLNEWLHGFREKTVAKAAAHEKLQLIVSRVDGVIEGVSSGQRIPLEDGSVWTVSTTTSDFRGHVEHPGVAVFKTFFGWKMRIGNVGEYYVTQVHH